MFILLLSLPLFAQETPDLSGSWTVNRELSDNTDKQVEKALREMGEKVDRCWFSCKEDRFRGGPEEQELYDRISYDPDLIIEQRQGYYHFTYNDNFQRSVYTDGRSQSVSLTGLDNVEDFSFGHWESNRFLVEARPRDGGFANETYSLSEDGLQLTVELYVLPRSFSVPVEMVRIYNRVYPNQ